MSMQTNANNTTLQISGGLAVKTQLRSGLFSDPDPVPLEAVRGAYVKDGISTQEPFDIDENESAINGFWSSVQAVPGDPSKGNLLERVLASVIPVNVSLQVSGDVSYAMITLKGPRRDPLVNKFPGDWETTVSTAPSTTIRTINRTQRSRIFTKIQRFAARSWTLIPTGCPRRMQASATRLLTSPIKRKFRGVRGCQTSVICNISALG